MNAKQYRLVKQAYQAGGEDLTHLYQLILTIAEETSLNEALAHLERCVTEKRLAWLKEYLGAVERTGNPLDDAFRIFYLGYLGLSTPEDGDIAERTGTKLVTRWWNRCPTLDTCQKLGLDTREICRKVQHTPVQAFLMEIDPRLTFDRNYERIRPHATYCEEIMTLGE